MTRMPIYPFSDLEVAPGTAPELIPAEVAARGAPELVSSDAPEVLPSYKFKNDTYTG